ncbi:MAG TPA: sulfotransferase [Steroidobacteraceae bacterium]|nr:sulfotransferase [Steroidobacteraceae bacterium]
MHGKRGDESAIRELREVSRLMRAGDWSTARSACRRLNARAPQFADGWLAASHIETALKEPEPALAAIERAAMLDPLNMRYAIQRAQCLLTSGRRSAALEAAHTAAERAGNDAAAWDAIGTVRSFAGDQAGALEAYDRAVALLPEESQFAFNRASVRRFLGDLQGAEADYDRAIAQRPLDFEAYLNRSELRAQTAERNHVTELEALARRPDLDWRGYVQIHYALAKECEDLGRYIEAFDHLQRGARRRREHLRYDVAVDVATAAWIASAFPAMPAAASPEASAQDPIFIVGLPRSGTTLVERILASHSSIASAGELDSFALSLVDAARRKSGRTDLPRQELVALSAMLDFPALGRDYLARARAAYGGTGRFIDKMPLNYLYCGLIRRALPNARIVHVVRQPMAVCHAMYKTLFKSGYPFSYDLREIGRYYAAYRRLMAHWQGTMPGAIYDLHYETLIADQAGETRKLLEYCGLEWEDACLAFHRNPTPSTTASASQVRRPLYDSSVSQWRHYEDRLKELKDALAAEGMTC